MRVDEAKIKRAAAVLLMLAAADAGGSTLLDEEASRIVSEFVGERDLLIAFVRLSASVTSSYADFLSQVSDGALDHGGALQVVDRALETLIADAERVD